MRAACCRQEPGSDLAEEAQRRCGLTRSQPAVDVGVVWLDRQSGERPHCPEVPVARAHDLAPVCPELRDRVLCRLAAANRREAEDPQLAEIQRPVDAGRGDRRVQARLKGDRMVMDQDAEGEVLLAIAFIAVDETDARVQRLELPGSRK